MKETLDAILQKLREEIEKAVKAEIEAKLEAIINKALDDLKEKIPGKLDDVAIEAVRESVVAAGKSLALNVADKIDGVEGN